VAVELKNVAASATAVIVMGDSKRDLFGRTYRFSTTVEVFDATVNVHPEFSPAIEPLSPERRARRWLFRRHMRRIEMHAADRDTWDGSI
jgi:hypothetical protein